MGQNTALGCGGKARVQNQQLPATTVRTSESPVGTNLVKFWFWFRPVPHHGSEGDQDPAAAETRERGEPDRDLQNQRLVLPVRFWSGRRRRRLTHGSVCLGSVAAATQFNRYKGSIYLVFDFCEHDLAGLLSNANVKFTLAEIKKVMQMLLNGLYYIHRNKVGEPGPGPGSGSAPRG